VAGRLNGRFLNLLRCQGGVHFMFPAHDPGELLLVIGEDASSYSGRLPATYENTRLINPCSR
jgi:hypothetical protein